MFVPDLSQIPTAQENEDNDDDNKKPDGRRVSRRQLDKLRKCVSNFSLYTNLVCNETVGDSNSAANRGDGQSSGVDLMIEGGEWRAKLSKSTKKRLRRQRRKKLLALNAKAAQVKKVTQQVVKKQTKKDLKLIMKKLSQI